MEPLTQKPTDNPASGLFFEARLGAHPVICKSIFIHTQIKLIFMWMKIDFAYEKMSTKTRFQKEAWGYSEMAFSSLIDKGLQLGTYPRQEI